MKSHITKRFRKAFKQLPKQIQHQGKESYKRFKQNPYHPSLHFKRIHSTQPIYSVRISLDYRAVGMLEGDAILWFWIGSHENYNRLLSQF